MQQQQADGSYQELWPKVDGWNKSQVLSDLTRELLGLESTSVPDDAFIALTIGKDSKAYRVKVIYPNGQPAVGFTVGGLTAFPVLGLVTNANGMVMGSSTSTNPTITVAQKYDDVKSYSGSFTSTRMITDCNVVLEWNEAPIKKSTSTFTPNLSDYCINLKVLAVGGGGGVRGRANDKDAGSGGGGGGGRNYNVDTVPIKNGDTIIISIGAGGAGGSSGYQATNGGTGGTTTVKIGTNSITASRRNGGNGASHSLSGGSTTHYSFTGRSGGTGNRNGGSGGSAAYSEDDERDYIQGTGWSTPGGNGQAGATVSFQGVSIATGGGGGGTGGFTWISGGPQQNQSPGNRVNSQAGSGGQGITGSWGSSGDSTNAGSSGGSWIAYLHE